jgi:hypothetical protein
MWTDIYFNLVAYTMWVCDVLPSTLQYVTSHLLDSSFANVGNLQLLSDAILS